MQGPRNTNWEDNVGIYRLRLQTGKKNCRPEPVNKNLGPRTGKYKLGAILVGGSRPVNTNWKPGLEAGARGQAGGRRLENTKTQNKADQSFSL